MDPVQPAIAPPRFPRFTIVDAMVLTACSAAPMGFVRWMISQDPDARAFTFNWISGLMGVAVPCMFGALVLGHPVLLLLHYLTGRRNGRPTIGEIGGLVPSISLVIVVLVSLAAAQDDDFAPPARGVAEIMFVANLCLSGGALVYLLASCIPRRFQPWTDTLATGAALFFGSFVSMTILLALVFR